MNLEKRIRATIQGRVQSQIEVTTESIEVQQKPLVVVTVSEGKNKPYLLKGTAYIRNNKDNIPMSRSELDSIYYAKTSRSDLASF